MVLTPGLTGEFGNDGRLRRAIFAATAVFICAVFVAGAWGGALAEGPIKVGLLLNYVGPTSIFARYEDKGAGLLVEQRTKAAVSSDGNRACQLRYRKPLRWRVTMAAFARSARPTRDRERL